MDLGCDPAGPLAHVNYLAMVGSFESLDATFAICCVLCLCFAEFIAQRARDPGVCTFGGLWFVKNYFAFHSLLKISQRLGRGDIYVP